MKHTIKRLLLVAVILLCVLSMQLVGFAADADTFNPKLNVEQTDAQTITVTVDTSNNAILAERTPSLIIPCGFEQAYVTFGDEVIVSVLDTTAAQIKFSVKAGGSYVIHDGEAPHTHTSGEAVEENSVAPTCTADGQYDEVVYCTECKTELSRKTVTVPKTGHDMQETAAAVAPTCEAAGKTAVLTCANNCGKTEGGEEVAVLDHTVVIDAAVAPTCTETGLTEGKHCSVCEKVLAAQEVVPATGHVDENNDGKCDKCRETVGEAPAPDELIITRISGSGRCETAEEAANTLKATLGVEKFDSIIIASGANFADALAGSYLAAVKNAPILLYLNDKSVTLNEEYIAENLAADGTVYILGGDSAVPAAVESRLDALGIEVNRLKGQNRFGTNLAILEEAGVQPGDEILVATGLNFADSLSASATGKPILLVNGSGKSLTEEQQAFLAQYGGGKLTILGGTGAVSAEIEKQLGQYGEVHRLSGKGRYETSTMIAEEYFGAVETLFIAYGGNFPDGLSGGPVAYAMGAPLVLTAEKSEATATAYVAANPVAKGYVMGGTGALSDEVVNKVFGK